MVLAAPAVLPHVPPARRGLASGAIFTGVGLGIAASGTLVPLLLRARPGRDLVRPGRARSAADRAGLAWLAARRRAAGRPSPWSRAAAPALRALYVEYGLNAFGLVPHMVFLVGLRRAWPRQGHRGRRAVLGAVRRGCGARAAAGRPSRRSDRLCLGAAPRLRGPGGCRRIRRAADRRRSGSPSRASSSAPGAGRRAAGPRARAGAGGARRQAGAPPGAWPRSPSPSARLSRAYGLSCAVAQAPATTACCSGSAPPPSWRRC